MDVGFEEEVGADCDEDHGVGDVDCAFRSRARGGASRPMQTKGPLDHPAPRQDLEALLIVALADDLNDKKSRQAARSMSLSRSWRRWRTDASPRASNSRIASRMIRTPALSEMSAVVGVTSNGRPSVSTAMWRCARRSSWPTSYPLFVRARRLDELAVDHARRRAGLVSGPLALGQQRHVIDGQLAKQRAGPRNQP